MTTGRTNTKRGASAIYVVIFTATLLSVISLSFVRLMLAESTRTMNYSLSQSAYNSALAGVEDAKIVLLRYQNCINSGGGTIIVNNDIDNAIDCNKYIETFNNKSSADDCDLIDKLLYDGRNTNAGKHETLIQTNTPNSGVSGAAEAFDQAYTCVKISRKNKNYLTTLNRNQPTKIIPIRTEDDDSTNSVNRIVINWFSRKNLANVRKDGTYNLNDYHLFSQSPGGMAGNITNNNTFLASPTDYANSFTDKPTVPTTIRATLIQTDGTFKLSQFYSAIGSTTNRGTITLRPSTANPYSTTETNYSNHIGGSDNFDTNGGPFANSARKSQNTPLDVKCYLDDNINTASGYACNTDIFIPRPIDGDGNNATPAQRNYSTFFLVVNLPYEDPETEISVELKNCKNASDSIYTDRAEGDSSGCATVDFANVQPLVDSTGRANDLFRRVEARIELIDTYFPIASYALAVDDPDGDDDVVRKDMYVTKNCNYTRSFFDETTNLVTTKTSSCPNAAIRN